MCDSSSWKGHSALITSGFRCVLIFKEIEAPSVAFGRGCTALLTPFHRIQLYGALLTSCDLIILCLYGPQTFDTLFWVQPIEIAVNPFFSVSHYVANVCTNLMLYSDILEFWRAVFKDLVKTRFLSL